MQGEPPPSVTEVTPMPSPPDLSLYPDPGPPQLLELTAAVICDSVVLARDGTVTIVRSLDRLTMPHADVAMRRYEELLQRVPEIANAPMGQVTLVLFLQGPPLSSAVEVTTILRSPSNERAIFDVTLVNQSDSQPKLTKADIVRSVPLGYQAIDGIYRLEVYVDHVFAGRVSFSLERMVARSSDDDRSTERGG